MRMKIIVLGRYFDKYNDIYAICVTYLMTYLGIIILFFFKLNNITKLLFVVSY